MTADDLAYLEQIRALSFDDQAWTSDSIAKTRDFLSPWVHNIQLAPGVHTAYCDDWYPESQAIMRVVDERLGSSYANRRVLDIGCLEGYYTLECAMHGADVVGVDAKEVNLKKCEFAKSVLGATSADFVLDDAMKLTAERYGTFDVVLALGLLYHLDDPYAFLSQVASLCRGFVVLDTIIASEDEPQTIGDWVPDLSPMRDFELGGKRYRGRLYREFQDGADDVERAFSITASHENNLSIWLTEESLVRMCDDVGLGRLEKVVFPSTEPVLWAHPASHRVLYVAQPKREVTSRIFV